MLRSSTWKKMTDFCHMSGAQEYIGDTHTQLHFLNNTKMTMMRGGFGTDGKAMADQLLPLSNNFLLHVRAVDMDDFVAHET